MSVPQPPKPVKLVIGLFMKEKSLLMSAAADLTEKFGPIEMVSCWFPFDFTDYYFAEMDGPLFRRVLSFKRLIEQSDLAGIKIATNDLEKKYSKTGKRMINIDPGYLSHERFVLATGKNYTHRIYIGHGIYADLTLIYQKGSFQTLPWTYPDYAQKTLRRHLEQVRERYAVDCKKSTVAGEPETVSGKI